MTVKDLLEIKDVSVDVCDDYDERCYIAYVSGYELTAAGVERFSPALDVEIDSIDGGMVGLRCPSAKEAQACKELFFSIAGFCGEKKFDEWFTER